MSMLNNSITRRLALPAWSVFRFSLTLAAAVLLAISLLTGALVVFWIGIPITVTVILAVRAWANSERRVIGEQLGIAVPVPYRPRVKARLDQQALALIREPATWRDVAWLAIDATLGFLVHLLYLGVFGIAVYYLVQPLLLVTVLPDPTQPIVNNFGLYDFDTPAKTLILVPVALACGAAWWRWGELFLRWYAHLGAKLLGPTANALLTARVSELRESRDQTVDYAAAELRRIERDLHDGAQARIAAVGLTLGMAEEMLHNANPDEAAKLVGEAREACSEALNEVRQLVRGIHPPVLADRGFAGALQAMSLDHPLPVAIVDRFHDQLPAPVEAAAYFATNEVLTNITKHAEASKVRILAEHVDGEIVIEIYDDGRGGATIAPGGGLDGVRRRLAAFDGTFSVVSPVGGPTVATLRIPSAASVRAAGQPSTTS
ncbi:sensor domain-containing protein [Glycomyces sp. L485]|uniref:sensor histidine kinase n=1 Tax=Glycomyces sp. L485 TaxID=2909235 RepID=UPI001F4A4C49|nr:sensor domain-containing protein [Glycomyces sp. L485]MCH7230256.1 sensor domain-containing protein [Glycomyces sp. L485]